MTITELHKLTKTRDYYSYFLFFYFYLFYFFGYLCGGLWVSDTYQFKLSNNLI